MVLTVWMLGCSDAAKSVSGILRADAGPDITVQSGEYIALDANRSALDGSVNFNWTQIDGPFLLFEGTLSERSPTLTAPSVTAKSTWIVELSVHNGKNTSKDQVQITVIPRDETAPSIVRRSPAADAANISVNPLIEIVFDEPLKETAALLAGAITLATSDGIKKHTGTIQYLNGASAENKPEFKLVFLLAESDKLLNGKPYTITLSSDIEDIRGNKRAAEQWSFNTVQSDNAYLSQLDIKGVALEPPFQSEILHYNATVGFLAQSVQLSAKTVDSDAMFSVQGAASVKGSSGVTIALAEGDNSITIGVTAVNSTKKLTYTINAIRQSANAFAQQAYVKTSNTEINDQFGISVALAGDTLAVGAYLEDSNATGVNCNNDITDTIPTPNGNGIPDCQENETASASGAVYVFTRTGTVWMQQAYIKASNTGSDEHFGYRVALAGDTLAVSAWGERSNATGVNCNNDITDTIPTPNGNGIPDCQENETASASGAVYVFTRTGTAWSQQAYIKASNTAGGGGFGSGVALAGDTLAVGAWGERSGATGVNCNNDITDSIPAPNGNGIPDCQENDAALDSGAAYVFTRTGTVWSQQAYIKASNTGVKDYFGFSVALSGDTLAVGAWGERSSATGVNCNNDITDSIPAPNGNGIPDCQENEATLDSGAVYVFNRSGTSWSQQAYIKASNTGGGDILLGRSGDLFGISVALDGDSLTVGANGEGSNATLVNCNNDSTDKNPAPNGIPDCQENNDALSSGAVYTFTRAGTAWSQQAYIKASNTGAGDGFGISVALSGDTLAVGAYWENSSATGVNCIDASGTEFPDCQKDGAASDSGAMYVYK